MSIPTTNAGYTHILEKLVLKFWDKEKQPDKHLLDMCLFFFITKEKFNDKG